MPLIKLQPQLGGSPRQPPDPGSNRREGCQYPQIGHQVVGAPPRPRPVAPEPGTQMEGARGGPSPWKPPAPLGRSPRLGGTQLGAGLAHLSVLPFWLFISSKFRAATAPFGPMPLVGGSEDSPSPMSSSWLLLKASRQQTRESTNSPPSWGLPQGAQKGWSF